VETGSKLSWGKGQGDFPHFRSRTARRRRTGGSNKAERDFAVKGGRPPGWGCGFWEFEHLSYKENGILFGECHVLGVGGLLLWEALREKIGQRGSGNPPRATCRNEGSKKERA